MSQPIMEVIKVLLEKISNFFDLFDISYLVSGVATLGVLCYLPHTSRFVNIFPEGFNGIWWFVACYAVGLASSSLGRRGNQFISSFNRRDRLGKYEHFETLLKVTKLDTTNWLQKHLISTNQGGITKYEESTLKNVYRLMWTSLRERKDIPESMALLRRYWVSSSTLDGLTVSSTLGIFVGLYYITSDWMGLDIFFTIPFWVTISLLLITRIFSQEANRYRRYQIEELVNTYILVKGL